MKKIYIDGLPLVEGHFSGIGQYTLGILRGIDEIITQQKYNNQPAAEVIVIITKDTRAKFLDFGFKNIGFKALPISFRLASALWRRRWLPPMDLWLGRGVYIFPRFVSMPLLFSKSIVVIYDMTFEKYRQFAEEKNAIFLSKQVHKTLRRTKKIITISQNSRNEILDFYKLQLHDVYIATPAADPHLFYRRSQAEINAVKKKYGVEGDYIIALSNLEPRKNLDGLVDAYCRLPVETRKNLSLLLVGVNGWKIDELFQKIIDKVQDGYKIIRPTEYVTDEDKPAIISGASLLVYPSHYEGFGIPPLEALACGVPVITADNSSLPEVVGDTGTMIPSDNIDLLSSTIAAKLASLEKETARAMIDGPKRAEQFSWLKSAKAFLDVAEEVVK